MDKNERSRLKLRRKRRKMNMMIKILIPAVLLIGIIIAVILILVSKKTFDTDASAIYLKKNGEILCASIDKLDKDYYHSEDLEKFVEEQIADYNSQSKSDVKMTSYKEEDKQVRLFIKYKNAQDYGKFNGQEFFAGTISQAKKAGYKLPKNAPSDSDLKVVIMEEKIGVRVDGDITYLSDNMEKINDHTATVKKSKNHEAQLVWVIYK